MKNCPDQGTLRAYLDEELAEAQRRRADEHLAICADCRRLRESMELALKRIDGLLDTLALEDLVAKRATRRGWRWATGALAAALAAAIVLFVLSGKPRVPAPMLARKETAAPASQPVQPSAALKRARVRQRRRARPRIEEFVGLAGADPIQMGMVVRVMVPVSSMSQDGAVRGIAADVVIGEDGRARAIRFVK